MRRAYPLDDIEHWYFELQNAVWLFEKEFKRKPKFVGYSKTTYNKINLIVNHEKDNVVDVDGNHPEVDEFIELGYVVIDEKNIRFLFCDEFPDDRFALMLEQPDGDDGEPIYTSNQVESIFNWHQVA